jgi:hypothetical protein
VLAGLANIAAFHAAILLGNDNRWPHGGDNTAASAADARNSRDFIVAWLRQIH